MTPTATQLKYRLDQRLLWFTNEWFFKWHHIRGQCPVAIDTFDGRQATYAGIKFSGSARDVFWDAIARGVRKEVIEQFAWIEERVRAYRREQAETATDECAALLVEFANSIRHMAVEKDRILRGDGINFPPKQDGGRWIDVSEGDIVRQATALKTALFPSIALGPEAPNPADIANIDGAITKYHVALSFAGEQREYVDAVAHALKELEVEVFYDQFETVTLWGKDGTDFFHQVFAAQSRYVVMFISRDYVRKEWTRHERRSALSRAIKEEGEYVLPVRFDDSVVPGVPETLQFVRAELYTPAALAALIAEKIGLHKLQA